MKTKKASDRKMSDMMKEMMEQLLRDPKAVPSSEAAHVALFFANVAWNECVGLGAEREGYRNVWQAIEAENPRHQRAQSPEYPGKQGLNATKHESNRACGNRRSFLGAPLHA